MICHPRIESGMDRECWTFPPACIPRFCNHPNDGKWTSCATITGTCVIYTNTRRSAGHTRGMVPTTQIIQPYNCRLHTAWMTTTVLMGQNTRRMHGRCAKKHQNRYHTHHQQQRPHHQHQQADSVQRFVPHGKVCGN